MPSSGGLAAATEEGGGNVEKAEDSEVHSGGEDADPGGGSPAEHDGGGGPPQAVELTRFRGHLKSEGDRRSSRCPEVMRRIRRSSGGRWSCCCAPAARPGSYREADRPTPDARRGVRRPGSASELTRRACHRAAGRPVPFRGAPLGGSAVGRRHSVADRCRRNRNTATSVAPTAGGEGPGHPHRDEPEPCRPFRQRHLGAEPEVHASRLEIQGLVLLEREGVLRGDLDNLAGVAVGMGKRGRAAPARPHAAPAGPMVRRVEGGIDGARPFAHPPRASI